MNLHITLNPDGRLELKAYLQENPASRSNVPEEGASSLNLLDRKEKQLQAAGKLGQRLLTQQMELEERIKQLHDEPDDDIDHALMEITRAWDTEIAQLSSALIFKQSDSPLVSLVGSPTAQLKPPTAAASRRAKNAAHRADDVEFAFEIGSGLLTEVRRLQSMLGERDKGIQDMKEEKEDLEKTVENLRAALRQQEQNKTKVGEETGNVEVTPEEPRAQPSGSQSQPETSDNKDDKMAQKPPGRSPDKTNEPEAPSPNSGPGENSADSPPNQPSSKPDSEDVAPDQGQQQPEPTNSPTDEAGGDTAGPNSILNRSSSRPNSEDVEYGGQEQHQVEPTDWLSSELAPAPALSELTKAFQEHDAIVNPTRSNVFQNAINPDVSHSVFNDVLGDQMSTVSNQLGYIYNYNERSSTGGFHPALPILIVQTAGLTAIWTKLSERSLTEARQDEVDRRMHYFDMYHATFASTLFPIAALMYLYKYSRHVS